MVILDLIRQTNKPLYMQVYESIKKDILSNKYTAGEMLPSEKEMGNLFNVDRITIRKAMELLSKDGFIDRKPGIGTILKGVKPVESSQCRGNIVLILPRSLNLMDKITEPFNSALFFSVQEECRKSGYTVTYTAINENNDVYEIVNAHNAAGLVFISAGNDRMLEVAFSMRLPVVLVNEYSAYYPSVVVDNEGGAYEAVRHLTSLGHKKIGMIRGIADYKTQQERFRGYVKALEEAGIDWRLQTLIDGNWSFDASYAAMKEILLKGDLVPTAIFAANDIMAFGAIRAIFESGRKVPDDISVTGFDNIEICKYMNPQLSTAGAEIEMIGKAICQCLFYSIDSKSIINIRVTIPTRFYSRESTAPQFAD